MNNLSENEVAVLELLVMKPRDFFPPMARRVARGLVKRGLAMVDNGEWFVTAAGVKQAHLQLH